MDELTPQILIDAGVHNIERDGVRYFRIRDIKQHFPEYKVEPRYVRLVDDVPMAEFKYIEKMSGFELIALASLRKKDAFL